MPKDGKTREKIIANWVLGPVMENYKRYGEMRITPEQLMAIIRRTREFREARWARDPQQTPRPGDL